MPTDPARAVEVLTGMALASRPAFTAMLSLPRLDQQPPTEPQQAMLTDWRKWLDEATAFRLRSFKNEDDALNAWADGPEKPGINAAYFFVQLGISDCERIFPSGE